MEHTHLKTARLVLRPVSLENVPARVRKQIEEGTAVGWELVEGDRVLGAVGIHHIDREHRCAHVGYDLDIEHRGKGFMREAVARVLDHAFSEMKLHRVEAHIDPKNAPSIRVVEALGFVREGVLRENFFKDGVFLDTAMYAMLEGMWPYRK